MIDYEFLKSVLNYNSESGAFTWLKPVAKHIKPGDVAGYVDASRPAYKRLKIGIRGREYFASRLAWLLHYGEWPNGEIDHIDRNALNNAINNLRVVDRSGNINNRTIPIQRNNKSGFRGVSFFKQTGKWRAATNIDKKKVHVGYFDTAEEAAAAISKFKEARGL
ncbi:HNH endonuclease [Citrobacter portucalensis]|uniref:HNH endonuclease n=1 Tax=Citrobacter portucalensis TaxID=1639133 RepID=A0ABD5H534_9ENTR|nr:HNH endonuclease [Citrobacter portucalensis]MDW2635890.1 HNH endonuclease [Citrobacter portucalensis]